MSMTLNTLIDLEQILHSLEGQLVLTETEKYELRARLNYTAQILISTQALYENQDNEQSQEVKELK